jgi:hypothetical protein
VRESANSTRLTFRGNLNRSRHGWLRLTPAYSVQLVERLVAELPASARVLDPFCGSGTTLLTCAERGLTCTTVDLNPFLVWLANAKAARYTPADCRAARELVQRMARASKRATPRNVWLPAISNIARWWEPKTQLALGRAYGTLERTPQCPGRDLATMSFCQSLIACAKVSFGHQSMSFRTGRATPELELSGLLLAAVDNVCKAAAESLKKPQARALLGDSRQLGQSIRRRRFNAVVTSPPYCNRMSYIRELRPYMYWLGHLDLPSSAGELDWKAIGGTWGVATSRLNRWRPSHPAFRGTSKLDQLTELIAHKSELLSRYVQRYFGDMAQHLSSLVPLLESQATLSYVIGNSKFYDVLLPTEQFLALQLEEAGLVSVRIEVLRTRTSKTELHEFLVTAVKP